ncbi:MAG: hypothetical protein R3C32_12060 [Chloroflexota bacterium]
MFDKTGKAGVVAVGVQSMDFGRSTSRACSSTEGYLSAYFVSDPGRMESTLDDRSSSSPTRKSRPSRTLVPALEKALQAGKKDILIIAEDVDGEALAALVVSGF